MPSLKDSLFDQKVKIALFVCLLFSFVWFFVPHPAVILVLSLLPIAIMVALYSPFLMVLFFIVFSFFRIHEVIPQLYSLKIPLMLSLGSLFALGWHIAISQKIKPWWRPEMSWMLFFYFLVLIGVIFASNLSVAIAYFTAIFWKVAFMSFAIAWLIKEERQFTIASRVIVIAGLIVGFKALSNQAAGIGMVEETRVTIGRTIGSVLGDPNDLALVLMFPMAFAVSFILTKRIDRTSQLLGLVAIGVLFMAVLATQSRGGLLGMMAVFGVFAYRRFKSKILFAVMGAAAAAALYVVAGISDRASGGAAEEGIDASAMGRIYAWHAAFNMAVVHPLTGVGIDNFYYNYFIYSPHWDGLNHAVHSTWFQILAETGFLGLAVFIIIITLLIRTALKTLSVVKQHEDTVSPNIIATSEAVLAGLIGTLSAGTFLTFGFSWPIYILAAMILATAFWVDKNVTENSSKVE